MRLPLLMLLLLHLRLLWLLLLRLLVVVMGVVLLWRLLLWSPVALLLLVLLHRLYGSGVRHDLRCRCHRGGLAGRELALEGHHLRSLLSDRAGGVQGIRRCLPGWDVGVEACVLC